jgi:hypothetical protein
MTLQFDLVLLSKEVQPSGAIIPMEGYITIYDVVGNRIAQTPKADLNTLFNGSQPAGTVKVYWNGRDLQGQKAVPGVYRAILSYTLAQKSGSISGKIGIKW